MDKKEKIGFIKRQFQRFMRKKQEIVENSKQTLKQFAYDNTASLRRVFAGAVLFSSLGIGGQAKAENTSLTEDTDIKRKIEINSKHAQIKTDLASTYIADMADFSVSSKGVKTSGVYNGHHLDFATARPETIVHMFEASGSSTILDAENIEKARYIGDFQFNLDNTIYELAKYCRKDFPALAKAAGVDADSGRIIKHNARTQEFYNVWCQLCNGADAEKFSRIRFEFMFKTHFKPTFDKLHQAHADFPQITIDNYAKPENFLFSALVMGTATQSPSSAFKIINKQINLAKEEAQKNGSGIVTPLDIYKRVSQRKKQLWGFAKRYNAEQKIATDMVAYFQATGGHQQVAQNTQKQQNKSQQIKVSKKQKKQTVQAKKNIAQNNEVEDTIYVPPAKVEYISSRYKKNEQTVQSAPTGKKLTGEITIKRKKVSDEKMRSFANAIDKQTTTSKVVYKEVPPTETPMVERPPEETATMETTPSDKKTKIQKIIERKKEEVRTKITIRRKKKNTVDKSNLNTMYVISSKGRSIET